MSEQIELRFYTFHKEYPQVYETLVRLAKEARANGLTRLGIGMLWEVMRWEGMIGSTDDYYKLNNNFRSRYARLIMEQEPDLRGVFEIRRLRSNSAMDVASLQTEDPKVKVLYE